MLLGARRLGERWVGPYLGPPRDAGRAWEGGWGGGQPMPVHGLLAGVVVISASMWFAHPQLAQRTNREPGVGK